jgi:hypothetical protein
MTRWGRPKHRTGFLILFLLGVGTVFFAACAPRGAKNWPFSIGPQTYAVALGDLDGDGDLDALAVGDLNNDSAPDIFVGSVNHADSQRTDLAERWPGRVYAKIKLVQ